MFTDIDECNGDSHVYMIQFDHVNGEALKKEISRSTLALKKEISRSTFVYVVQTLPD